MKIFFMNSIGTDAWGGGEKWMLTTAKGLRERGHEIYFCGRQDSLFLKNCVESGFEILPMDIKSDFGMVNIFKLSHFLEAHEIDIIIANFNKDVRLAGVARKLARTPVLLARNGLPILQNNWRYRYTYKFFADGIITNTESISQRYLKYGWLDEKFIRVIHNGIGNHSPEVPAKELILDAFGIENRSPIVGIFGRLVKQKQHNIFLEIAKNLLPEWPNAGFLIVGDGPLRDSIKKYASDLGIWDNLYMPGMQNRVMELYSICDVVLLTSEEEGLPNTVMEAMLMERPVVAFDVGGVGDLVLPDKTGVLVPPNDIYMMTRRTQELLLAAEFRECLGRNAREHILKNFALEKMINEIENYLEEKFREKKEIKDGA